MARILVVEDDAVISKFYCRLIEVLPGRHECLVARTSMDAIKILEQGSADLILLDMQLAEATSGRRFLVHCHHLFEESPDRRIPVIIISGIEERDLEGLRKAYPFVVDVFSKPFDMDDLAAVLADATKSTTP
jgi:CheY-like chemotaxis protein